MKNKGLYIKISEEEKKMMQELRKIHSINISNLIRKLIKDYYFSINNK